jgi:hypothetical protein
MIDNQVVCNYICNYTHMIDWHMTFILLQLFTKVYKHLLANR